MVGLNRYFSDDFSFQDPDVKVNGIEGMLLLIFRTRYYLASISGRIGTDSCWGDFLLLLPLS